MELTEVQSRLPTHEEVWESTGDAQFKPSWETLATGMYHSQAYLLELVH